MMDRKYQPGPVEWVRKQVEEYEESGGTRANTLRDTGLPVVIVTTVGRKTNALRKGALMRVNHGDCYALVGSIGGAPHNPEWVHNLRANPSLLMIQDGPRACRFTANEAEGKEREEWWARAVAAYPNYAEYQERTSRTIPVFVARPVPDSALDPADDPAGRVPTKPRGEAESPK